jgi:hypothetical protein
MLNTGVAETNERIWFSRLQFAERIDVPVKTTAEWATKGLGPRYAKFGKHVRYRLADIVEWENSRMSDANETIEASEGGEETMRWRAGLRSELDSTARSVAHIWVVACG